MTTEQTRLPWVKWYPTDWMGDAGVRRAPLEVRGAWFEILQQMFHDSRHTISLPVKEWALLMGCTVDRARRMLHVIRVRKIARVSGRSDGNVTVTCRRLEREAKKRDLTKLRMQKLRGKDVGRGV